MNPKLKSFLIIVVKQAALGLMTSGVMAGLLPTIFSIHTTDGLWNLLKAAGAAMGSQELKVWGPVVYKWISTNNTPD